MTVYAEGYAALNLFLNAVLLRLCAGFCGLRPKKWRVAASSVLGCAYGFVCFLPGLGAFSSLFGKVVCAFVMVLAAFGPRPFKLCFRLWAAFFVVTFLLGGTGFGLVYLLGSGGFSIWLALGMACVGAVALRLLLGSRHQKRIAAYQVRIELVGGGKVFQLNGFVDTGNRLIEPVSALPVLVCSEQSIKQYLPEAHRCVGFESAGGGGTMALYKPDAVYLVEGASRREMGGAYVAFCDLSAGKDGFDVLVPPSLI